MCSALPSQTVHRPQVDCNLVSILHQQGGRHHSKRNICLNYVHNTYDGFTEIYTDGSKSTDGAGIAVYIPENEYKIQWRCSNRLSISELELLAISSALEWIVERGESYDYAILSDCLNCIKLIGHSGDGSHQRHPRILRDIISLHRQAINLGSSIHFVWIPGHARIEGNEVADSSAKEAASDESSDWHPTWPPEYDY